VETHEPRKNDPALNIRGQFYRMMKRIQGVPEGKRISSQIPLKGDLLTGRDPAGPAKPRKGDPGRNVRSAWTETGDS